MTAEENPHSASASENPHSASASENPHSASASENPHSTSASENPHSASASENPHSASASENPHSGSASENPHSPSASENPHSASASENIHSASASENPHSASASENPHSASASENPHSPSASDDTYSSCASDNPNSPSDIFADFDSNNPPMSIDEMVAKLNPINDISSDSNEDAPNVTEEPQPRKKNVRRSFTCSSTDVMEFLALLNKYTNQPGEKPQKVLVSELRKKYFWKLREVICDPEQEPLEGNSRIDETHKRKSSSELIDNDPENMEKKKQLCVCPESTCSKEDFESKKND
ncbi:sporozoite surface protein 2-like isoform X2 [Diorhabda sublineata]|uniref:sporozoite surface protein 2-like isoform X2 n=1 Tax=Diorhabda sublineata TaxID=1163346 RepID=UPI0024E093E7|nr:sporozoite surface protein 2-like isoform X2 [Diorhabda sublineata]